MSNRWPVGACGGLMTRVALCHVALLAACHAAARPREEAAAIPDPRVLSGRWSVELSDRHLFSFGPAMLGGPKDPYMLGELQLDSMAVPIGRDSASVRGVRGQLVRLVLYGEEPPRVAFPAVATFRPDGQAAVTVTFPGPCPCMSIELVGVLGDGEIRGRSSTFSRDFTSHGRFVLLRQRAPVP